LVYQDECWFSRFAQPTMRAWAKPQETVKLIQRDKAKDDPEPKALACFGALEDDTRQTHLSFADGQPDNAQTQLMLQALLEVCRVQGRRVLAIIWDKASWHTSLATQQWIHAHNQQARQNGDVRIFTRLLPTRSPWLNPIEPGWIHAKRNVAEFGCNNLTIAELTRRLCAHFDTEPLAIHPNHLS
jgi:transposase